MFALERNSEVAPGRESKKRCGCCFRPDLAVAHLKLKLKKNWTGAAPRRNSFEIGQLKE